MIDAMPQPRPPYLHKEITRHDKTVWYVRIGKGSRVRINETYGTPAFKAAYHAAVGGKPLPESSGRKAPGGTLAWAIKLYRHSKAWSDLSPATRKQRGCILEKIERSDAGLERIKGVTKATITAGCQRRAATPAAARHFVQTMRGLFKWAIDEEHVEHDPTFGVVAKAAKTDGHQVWTETDIAAYQRRWPVGTRERVAFDVLLYTGLRRGDAVTVGLPHVKDGIIRLRTEKTGEIVTIVICAELAQTLAAGPCGDLTFIAGVRGLPRVKESFGEWFRSASHAAKVKKTAHGLRKAAATRDANDGASESELEAIYGWRGGRMASHYTREANRERLAIGFAEKQAKRKA